jgi:hypothetical protein
MKKTKYCITWLLCLIFVFSMATSVVMGIINKVNAGAIVKKEYYELSYKDLDNITNRRTKPTSSDLPQITVFTYGCGGNLGQWSNNGKANSL